MTTADIETVVIGGGVVGLAAARTLSQRGSNVLLLERNDRTGAETSSRNSEVIHAGLYYPTGSLRARLCVGGKHRLYRFAEENGVAVNRCGKLLVATSEADLPMLESIAERAAANGVDDMARLNRHSAKAMEPEVECIAALFSPSTGVIDTHALMTALEGHLTASGGEVVLSTEVVGISLLDCGLFEIQTRNTAGQGTGTLAITAKNLVLAAGLEGTRVGEFLNGHWREGYTCPRTYPAKGHYFTLSARAPFTRLIYPIPSGAWLGVHLTLDIAGQAKFGPDLEWVDEIDYGFDDPDGTRRQTFIKEIRRYWPQLPANALHPGYTGIRPKIYRRGEPTPDFAIHGPQTHGVDNLVALYGIESPGLTSSLAIADYVADIICPQQ